MGYARILIVDALALETHADIFRFSGYIVDHGNGKFSRGNLGHRVLTFYQWQSWYIGPLAATIGTVGGDLGNELTLVVTSVTYIPLRYLELKYIGR